MNLLLDTHIFLLAVKDDRRLIKKARALISDASDVYVSSASIWEAAIKIKLDKLDADIHDLLDAIIESDYLELPVNSQHAARIIDLPEIHRDPFDRILIAQAMTEPLKILTSDVIFEKYTELAIIV